MTPTTIRRERAEARFAKAIIHIHIAGLRARTTATARIAEIKGGQS